MFCDGLDMFAVKAYFENAIRTAMIGSRKYQKRPPISLLEYQLGFNLQGYLFRVPKNLFLALRFAMVGVCLHSTLHNILKLLEFARAFKLESDLQVPFFKVLETTEIS